MSQNPRIVDAVRSFEGPGRLPGQVEIDLDEGGRLALALTEVGPVGLAFDRLDFHLAENEAEAQSHGPAAARGAEALRAWADRLAARATYLMEPLVVVEHDVEAGAVDVRSKTPTVRNGRRAYYEVRLARDGTLSLTRVVYDEAARRRQVVPCTLTYEALDRLVDDIRTTAAAAR